MPDESNKSDDQIRDEVLQKLKETLNLHRQIAEENEPTTTADSANPESAVLKRRHVRRSRGNAQPVRKSDGSPSLAHMSYADNRMVWKKAIARAIQNAQEEPSDNFYVPSLKAPVTTQVAGLDPEERRKKLNNRDFKAEIKLKKSYGKWFLIILAVQLAVMNLVFIFDGLKWLDFEPLTLQLYMGGTLTEVFGLVLVVTKYLFKKK
ncbi:hypothetical protein QFL30_003564 [Klebsiella oxytoca]|nr:hypothetical protein [Klebsiella oxytoca]